MVALNRWTCWGTTRDHRPDVIGVVLADVPSADGDGADLELPEPQQQLHQRRLAGAARTDQAEAAARRDRQVERLECRRFVRRNTRSRVRRCGCRGRPGAARWSSRRDHRRWRVDDLEQARARRGGGVVQLHRLHQRLHRLEAGDGGQRHQGQVDAVELAAADQRDGDAQQGDRGETGQQRSETGAQSADQRQSLPYPVQLGAQLQGPPAVSFGLRRRRPGRRCPAPGPPALR